MAAVDLKLARARPPAPPPEPVPAPVRSLNIALVSMPWASLDMPSLALSTLAPVATELDYVANVDVIYANLRWADFMYEQSGQALDSEEYRSIVDGYYVATGEWIFSPAYYGYTEPEATPFYSAARRAGADLDAAARMYRLAPRFVAELAADIVAGGYDILGLTSTFDQNMPSLALARMVKELDPRITVIMGGANCDDVQGSALHRNFGCLDFVVRGEGELVFPELLGALAAGLDENELARWLARAGIDGLCYRDENGDSVACRQASTMVPIDRIPEADVSGYFAAFRGASVTWDVEPKIQVEGGRGCWWGEKHHCTFCGLNGSLMAFRAKSPDRVLAEISRAVQANKTLDVVFADNIMDMAYVRDLMPALGELGWDLRLFFEVKSNLSYRQLKVLAEAGVAQIQPGIESLSTHVLKVMRKGVTAWQNIRLLRDCRSLAIYPGWNILYGFPGETDTDYLDVISQMPNLAHLAPPEGCYRVVLTRFSPYFRDPSLGLSNRGPSGLLTTVYQLPRSELADLSYIFESEETGIVGDVADSLSAAFGSWRRNHPGRRLVALDEGTALRIVDERWSPVSEVSLIDDPLEVDAFRLTLRGSTVSALERKLAEAGHRFATGGLGNLVASWAERGWIYRDGDHVVCLATGLGYE